MTTSDADDDYLDGICDLDAEMGPETTDEIAPYVVLFATFLDAEQQVTDWPGVHVRAAEWRNLFGGADP